MTLDVALCEWCTKGTPATAKAVVDHEYPAYLCSTHCQELETEFRTVQLYPIG